MPITASIEGHPLDPDGALDPDQVMIQFVCNTGPGEHDPDAPPDERVRPTHAALHGRLFTLEAGAPIPPLDYGCRCQIQYVAVPGTQAARVMDEAKPGAVEDTVTPAYEAWLDKHAPEWHQIAKAAAAAPKGQEANAAYLVAKRLGYARDVAQMAMQVAQATAEA